MKHLKTKLLKARAELAKEVLDEIERHLKKYPMSETYFGILAARYPNVISRLREGGSVNEKVLTKLLEFIESREAEEKAKAKASAKAERA